MNRLYWLNDQGLWELVEADEDENHIMRSAARRLYDPPKGIVGYARYENKQYNGVTRSTVWWSEYIKHEGGSTRASKSLDQIPKPIQLLEMLYEPHAPS